MKQRLEEWSKEAWLEVVVAVVLSFGLCYLFISQDAFEWWYHFTREHEDWQLDELVAVLIAVLGTGTVLAFRHVYILRRLMKELAEANVIIGRQAEIKSKRDKLVALGELSGGLAHEINNALQPAIGLGGFIKEGLIRSGNVKHLAFMDTILNSAQHAQHVIENVLVFTQDRNPDLSPHRAAEVISEAVQFGRDLLPTTIIFDVSGFPPPEMMACSGAWIEANKTSLCQILLNIFKNASKAMNGAGKITISYRENDMMPGKKNVAAVSLDIEDMGGGIDEAIIGRIFDPFFTTRDISEGAGLGLSVVHGLMQQHKGVVSVRSTKGKSTTFTLYFPVYTQLS